MIDANAQAGVTCGRARRLLWPEEELRVLSAELVAARAHADACAACQAFLREMAALRELTRTADRAKETVAPRDARERLFLALARRRASAPTPRRQRRTISLTAVAAALLLTLGLGIVWQLQRGEPQVTLLAALTDDHARTMSGEGLRSSDAGQVTRWLAERVPFPLHIPTFDDVTLVGARLHVREGRRGAVMEYAVGTRTVSYFVVPAEEVEVGHMGGAAVAAALANEVHPALRYASHAGYAVVFWQDGDVLHAFVGDLHPSGLERLARSCIRQAQAAMHAMVALGA